MTPVKKMKMSEEKMELLEEEEPEKGIEMMGRILPMFPAVAAYRALSLATADEAEDVIMSEGVEDRGDVEQMLKDLLQRNNDVTYFDVPL